MIRILSPLAFALVSIGISGLKAGADDRPHAGAPVKVTGVEGITEYRLANGLRVLLFPDPTRQKFTVNLTVLVGSRHEGYGESGMAHLLEHMAYKGTPTHPDIPAALKERGASFNGSTWLDRTNYYETLPASDDNLEFALGLEADRMVNSPIKAEDLASEFSVVRNEFEASENDPAEVLSERMMSAAYEWHNYGKSTIGNRSDIERVPVDSLRAFYKKYYQPDNALLVVAGKFNEQKALELINKYFAALPKPDRKLPATYTEEPPQDGERFVTLRRVGDVALVGLLYHIPAAAHAEFPAVRLLTSILTDEPSGRLYKALVETHKAASVSATTIAGHDPGAIQLTAEVNTKDPAVLEQVRDVMLSVLDDVARSGVTQEEVNRARQRYLKNRELAAAEPNRIAVELSEWQAQGDWRLYFLFRDRIEKVTPAQVKEVALKYFTTSNRTVGYFLPVSKPERTPIPPTPDVAKLVDGYTGRAIEDRSLEAADVSPSAIEAKIERPQPIAGVKLAFLPKKTRNQSVQLTLALHYGNADNLRGLSEAASFLPELMTRGTKSMSRQAIHDALDKNFARLGTGAGGMHGMGAGMLTLGVVRFSLETKRANLAAAVEILRQILREPTLPAREFQVMKEERLAAAEQGRSDPVRQAFNHIQKLLARYPSDDVRYVPTVDEQIDRLKKITIEQIQTLYNQYLGAEHGELVIVGDFEPSEIMPVLAQTFDGWKANKPFARIERPCQTDLTPTRETVLTPDKENAAFLAGMCLPIKDDHPEYPALVAGNFILGGGGLSSRIADRLRQKGGLSYSAGTIFAASPLDPRADLILLAIYNPANRDKVVNGAEEELERLVKGGVQTAELEKAKTGFLRQLALERTSDGMLARVLIENLYVGRTMQFHAEFEERVRNLTPEAVNAALSRHIDPKRLSVVTAGDFEKK
jgi:zinc protease